MDKFPKMETIEATLYGQRVDNNAPSIAALAKKLDDECPEFDRVVEASIQTLVMGVRSQLPLEITMSICLSNMLEIGVAAERARAECEQLQDAMNPRQLTEGRQPTCDKDSCADIT